MGDTTPSSLGNVCLFEALTDAEREPIERVCRWRRFAPQEQIIDRQGEAREVFFVVEGRVRVVNYSLSGREVTLDDVPEGGHFGELAAIDGQPRSASVMALTDTLLATLPHEHFLEAMKNHWSVALTVILSLTRIVRASTERIMDLSTLGANNRVHGELLRQARSAMINTNEAMIAPIPVHSDLASRVSTTRETVARVMNDLARRKILERTRSGLLVKDVSRLEAMVEHVRGE